LARTKSDSLEHFSAPLEAFEPKKLHDKLKMKQHYKHGWC